MEFITEYCRLFSATVSVPVSYYNKDLTQICSYPKQEANFDFSTYMIDELLNVTKKPACIHTGSNVIFGIVDFEKDNGFLVIGPCVGINPSSEVIYAFMHEAMISVQHYPLVESLLNYSSNFSQTQLKYTLLFLHFSLNGTNIDILTHFNFLDEDIESNISSKHSGQLYHLKENQRYHNTYHFEQQYLEYIRQGQPEKLKKFFLESNSVLKEGQIADDALRQAKNIFIAGTTMVTRSAIAGGLDIEQAYQLSDVYIKECEKQQDSAELSNLNFSMCLDFARRVEKCKIPAGMSADTFECIQFVTRHTNEAIQVEDVARHINRCRSYTSRKFKSEMGFDLSTFIMRCKLEEAKNLLTHTNKSLSEISSYLCFSSQSYFQNVFKKKYGLTPLQYRNQSTIK